MSYDNAWDWEEDRNFNGAVLSYDSDTRGETGVVIRNESDLPIAVQIVPVRAVIGKKYKVNKPGHDIYDIGSMTSGAFSLSDRRSSDQDIYSRVILSLNDFTIPPGGTAVTAVKLVNWYYSTEEYVIKVNFLIRRGDVRDKVVLELAPDDFLHSGEPDSSPFPVELNISGSINITF